MDTSKSNVYTLLIAFAVKKLNIYSINPIGILLAGINESDPSILIVPKPLASK